MESKSPLGIRDTFLSIVDFLPSHEVLKLRKVCKDWKRYIDQASWNWGIISEYELAEYRPIQLGKMDRKNQYTLVTQLGQYWNPGESYFVLVREDNCIEVKKLAEGNSFSSVYVTPPQTALVTVLCPLRGGLYMTGDAKGSAALWNTTDAKELRRFQAHESAISALFEVSRSELISASKDGKIICWEMFQDSQVKKWEISEKLPIKTIQKKNDEIQIILVDQANKTFNIKCFSLKDGSERSPVSAVRFGVNASMHPLSQVMFFKNRFLIELRTQKRMTNQSVYVCNNKWKVDEKAFKPNTSKFELNDTTDSWNQGHQTYILPNGNFLFQSYADGSAKLGIPKRLPLTRAEESSDSVSVLKK